VANSRSARKRIRANERKHVRNRTVRSAVRTRITRARRALLGADTANTPELVLAAVRELDRAAEKGILHRNNAKRRKSRLMSMAHRLLAAEGGAGEEQAAARAAAAGGEKGRGRGRAVAKSPAKTPAKSTVKSTAKTTAKPAAKTATRAAADKPKTATRAKKA
jgi:small subunit ribosomal protein S20